VTHAATDVIEGLSHDALYVRLLDYRAKQKDGLEYAEAHEALANEVNDLLDKLDKITPEIRLLNDYTWLINASLQWQAYAALLNINRKIKIPQLPDDGLWAPTQRLGKDDVDHWLASRERDICRLRHLKHFLWQVRNVQVEPQDEYSAKTYFAKDTLNAAMAVSEDGSSTSTSIDLVEKVLPGVYGYWRRFGSET
jgi:hypothetical protein